MTKSTPMKTEDIISALANPLGAAALDSSGHPSNPKEVVGRAVRSLDLLSRYQLATAWALSELRGLFHEFGAPASDRGQVQPDQFAAWIVGLVSRLYDQRSESAACISGHECCGDLTSTRNTVWNRPEQFGLPPGYTINNPANLSPDQIGEGYRIATTADDTNLPNELFVLNKLWGRAFRTSGTFAEFPGATYRVPADRPLPPLENDKP